MTVTDVKKQVGERSFRVHRDIEEKKFDDPDWDPTLNPGWKQHRIGDLHYFLDDQEVTRLQFRKAAMAAGLLKEEDFTE